MAVAVASREFLKGFCWRRSSIKIFNYISMHVEAEHFCFGKSFIGKVLFNINCYMKKDDISVDTC